MFSVATDICQQHCGCNAHGEELGFGLSWLRSSVPETVAFRLQALRTEQTKARSICEPTTCGQLPTLSGRSAFHVYPCRSPVVQWFELNELNKHSSPSSPSSPVWLSIRCRCHFEPGPISVISEFCKHIACHDSCDV